MRAYTVGAEPELTVLSSGYLDKALIDIQRVVAVAEEDLTDFGFDIIVCTGVSGMLVAPVVAHKLDKRICVVRATGLSKHANSLMEGVWCDGDRWLWLDDFIMSGETEKHVHSAVAEIAGEWVNDLQYAGRYLWASGGLQQAADV
jgi:adenine/guanine phosphoribosyltransferase-like PRPP-binding protein